MADNLRSVTELPILKDVPNGTYTVVVDGSTAKLAPYGGGGGASAINIVYETADMSTFTCNMSYEEMHAALVEGNGVASVSISVPMFGGILAKSNFWSFVNGAALDSDSVFIFNCDTGSDALVKIVHAADNTITVVGF